MRQLLFFVICYIWLKKIQNVPKVLTDVPSFQLKNVISTLGLSDLDMSTKKNTTISKNEIEYQ